MLATIKALECGEYNAFTLSFCPLTLVLGVAYYVSTRPSQLPWYDCALQLALVHSSWQAQPLSSFVYLLYGSWHVLAPYLSMCFPVAYM